MGLIYYRYFSHNVFSSKSHWRNDLLRILLDSARRPFTEEHGLAWPPSYPKWYDWKWNLHVMSPSLLFPPPPGVLTIQTAQDNTSYNWDLCQMSNVSICLLSCHSVQGGGKQLFHKLNKVTNLFSVYIVYVREAFKYLLPNVCSPLTLWCEWRAS